MIEQKKEQKIEQVLKQDLVKQNWDMLLESVFCIVSNTHDTEKVQLVHENVPTLFF